MFDYISALYYGESPRLRPESPLTDPDSKTEQTLIQQLKQVRDEMGCDFYDSLYKNLYVVLEERRRDTFRRGIHSGAHLMLALLDEER